MQRLTFDTINDSAMAVALTRNDIAHQSVQALLDDIDHVVGSMDHDDRAGAARAVLEHHDPPVDDGLLSTEGRALQSAARHFLEALVRDEIRPDDLDRLISRPEPAPVVRTLPERRTGARPNADDSIGSVPRLPVVGSPLVVARFLRRGTMAMAVAAVGYGIGTLLAQVS